MQSDFKGGGVMRGLEVKVSAVQLPPASEDKGENLKTLRRLILEAGRFGPDYILLNELATTPYFGGHQNPRHLAWAEPVPGPSTQEIGELARSLRATILLPLCERSGNQVYNSVALISPEGDLIEGTLPDGTPTPCYRKTHLADVEAAGLKESFYFSPGEGLPVFRTPKATLGVLICYDRCFPEAWRTLTLQGAEILFVPSCIPAWYPEREAQTLWELRTRALENQVFVVATNKAGKEELDGKATPYFGHAVILGPAGDLLAEGPSMAEGVIHATLDLGAIQKGREKLPFLKARRPEIYHLDVSIEAASSRPVDSATIGPRPRHNSIGGKKVIALSDKELIEHGREEAGSLWKLSTATGIHLSTLTNALKRGGNISEFIRRKIYEFLALSEKDKQAVRLDKRRKPV